MTQWDHRDDHLPPWTQGDVTDVRGQLLQQIKFDQGVTPAAGVPLITKAPGYAFGKVSPPAVSIPFQAAVASALLTLTAVNQDVPGASIATVPGVYLCQAMFDVVVSVISAGNLVIGQILPVGAVANTAPAIMLGDMRTIYENTFITYTIVTFAAAGSVKLIGRVTGGAGTAQFQSGNACTTLTLVRLS